MSARNLTDMQQDNTSNREITRQRTLVSAQCVNQWVTDYRYSACELRQERLHGNTFHVGSGTLVETLGEKRTKDGATRERELYKAAAAQGLHGDGGGRAGTAL